MTPIPPSPSPYWHHTPDVQIGEALRRAGHAHSLGTPEKEANILFHLEQLLTQVRACESKQWLVERHGLSVPELEALVTNQRRRAEAAQGLTEAQRRNIARWLTRSRSRWR